MALGSNLSPCRLLMHGVFQNQQIIACTENRVKLHTPTLIKNC